MFIDSVIRNNSLSSFECNDSDSDDEIELSCSGDDASESSDNSECGEDIDDDLQNLQMSFDQDFMEHIDDNVGTDSDVFNLTNPECVQMDITSELDPKEIELNVPVTDLFETEKPLLPEGYERSLCTSGIEKELLQAVETKFICSRTKLKELFTTCLNPDCGSALVELNETFIKCTLEMRWKYMSDHTGMWQSSESIGNVYINNMQLAASLLFSGNNYTEMSLFAVFSFGLC